MRLCWVGDESQTAQIIESEICGWVDIGVPENTDIRCVHMGMSRCVRNRKVPNEYVDSGWFVKNQHFPV